MACDGNRNAHFAAVAGGGSAVAQAFGGSADAQQALDTLFELGRNGPKPDAAAPLAQAQTRLMFAQMQRRGLKPPTHSASGLPKADAQFGYALVQQTLAALDRGEPLPPQARDLLLSSGRTRQIANVRSEATGRVRCGSCGQFASPLRGHTCPRTASVDTLRRSLVRRLKVPPSAYPDTQLTELLNAARSGPVTMRHNATGEEVTVTLDALPLALANGFIPELWVQQGRRAVTTGGSVVTVIDDRNMMAVPEPPMQDRLLAKRDEVTQRLRLTRDPDELTRLNRYRNDLDGAIRENAALASAAANHGLVLTPDLPVIDPVVIDFETYATMRGASRQGFGDAGLHSPAAHVSGTARRRHLARQSEHDTALMARRDELRAEYEQKVADGELRPPTNSEQLAERAAGSADNESTHAAQRVLTKRAVRAVLTPTIAVAAMAHGGRDVRELALDTSLDRELQAAIHTLGLDQEPLSNQAQKLPPDLIRSSDAYRANLKSETNPSHTYIPEYSGFTRLMLAGELRRAVGHEQCSACGQFLGADAHACPVQQLATDPVITGVLAGGDINETAIRNARRTWSDARVDTPWRDPALNWATPGQESPEDMRTWAASVALVAQQPRTKDTNSDFLTAITGQQATLDALADEVRGLGEGLSPAAAAHEIARFTRAAQIASELPELPERQRAALSRLTHLLRTRQGDAQIAAGSIAHLLRRLAANQPAELPPTVGTPLPAPNILPTVGRTAQAYGSDPTRAYELRYRVVDLDDLIPSNLDSGGVNPAYDMALQPRQRDRAASQAQIAKVAQTLTPDALLTDFQQLDKGTPIIGAEDTCVESGNGRVLALRKARESFPERWEAYQSRLREVASSFGLDPAAVAGMRAPVLVRERVDALDRAAFAREANAPPVLQMSTLENAVVDARRMSDDLLLRLNMREDQSIDLALRARGNAGFVRDFMQTLPENERATLMRGDGSLNQQGIWRIKAALFTRTFPGEAGRRLAETFTESLDSTTKNFEQAVAGTLPQLIRAQSRLSSGQRNADLDLSGDMAASLDMLARLREQELPVPVYLEQSTLFERELTPTQEKMLRHFDSIGRSSKAIRGFLSTYAQAIEDAPDPNQNDMFGGGGLTKDALLARLLAPRGADITTATY